MKHPKDRSSLKTAPISILNEFSLKSAKMRTILDLLKSIAAETHLLSLNASIEAAGAGEQGVRFGVVAQEVKHLATRSSSASKEVVAIIKEIEDTTQLAITTVTDGASKAQELQEVTKQTGYVIDEMSEVAEHAQKQAVSIRGIAKEVSELTELIRSSTAQQESASEQVVFALMN